MIDQLLVAAVLLGGSIEEVDSHESLTTEDVVGFLTREERDKIYRAIHLAVNKMNRYMDLSEQEANLIFDVKIRNATLGCIQGCISGLATRNPYGVVISGCLGGFANIAGDSYTHFCRSRNYVRQAKIYGLVADELQERLWRD